VRHRLLTGWLTAVVAVGLLGQVPASATSKPKDVVLAADWASADLTVVREGWTVLVSGTVADTRDDDDCVYVKTKLVVEDYYDQDDRTDGLCTGAGSSRDFQLFLSPRYGSRLVSVQVAVCAADRFMDSCEAEELPVPAERAIRPELKEEIDEYLRMPLAEFLKRRDDRPGPFDWGSDGCTDAPDDPNDWNFRDACSRHDFGYRNYGGGDVQASPTDATRAAVDDRFRDDLHDACAGVEERRRCKAVAESYYAAVRRTGGNSFYS
jgi:hypothetical protein